jgi:hypothetical protein
MKVTCVSTYMFCVLRYMRNRHKTWKISVNDELGPLLPHVCYKFANTM